MITLESGQLEFAFRAQGITLEEDARRFYTDLWTVIKSAEKIRDPLEFAMCEHHLRKLCKAYFARTQAWRNVEEEKYDSLPACPHSLQNRQSARQCLPAFERQFFRYALCYLELNRALIQNRAQVSFFAKEFEDGKHPHALEVNSATGPLLDRAHRERKVLMDKRLRLDRIRSILATTDPLWDDLVRGLSLSFDGADCDRQLTLFKGMLRKSQFEAAKRIAKGWGSVSLEVLAHAIIAGIEHHVETLKAQDSLVLQSSELNLMAAFLKNDEDRINQFMEKFNVPYMVYQYKNLLHLAYLLGRIGSLESLIILHARLVALSARTEGNPESARKLELAVLVPTKHLFDQGFRTLGAIFNDMEGICAILEKLFTQTRDYQKKIPTT